MGRLFFLGYGMLLDKLKIKNYTKMDEQQFYIETCLIGVWDNENYSFIFNGGGTKLMSITDKINAPRTGTGYSYHIVKEDFYYVLRLIITDGDKVAAIDYKIDNIDCSIGVLKLSSGGATLELNKIVEFSPLTVT
jgi:hypothetical protein